MGKSNSTYKDTAWGYDTESIGIDPTTGKKFKPTQKELDLFVQDKRTMYKGTFMICLVYGISALLLLTLIFFTEWGKTYVYDSFLPAVITYVIGAIFIIIYLLFAIFALKPRKITREFDQLPICPDYWIHEPVDEKRRESIVENNETDPVNPIIKDNSDGTRYVNNNSTDIAYKCVPNPKVFGSLDRYRKMREDLDDPKYQLYMASQFQKLTDNQQIRTINTNLGGGPGQTSNADIDKRKLRSTLDFLYIQKDTSDGSYITGERTPSTSLEKYAKFVGSYNNNTQPGPGGKKAGTLYVDSTKNYDKKPLICSEVFPKVLDKLQDDNTKDDLKCEFAKACNVSWSELDCYKDNKEGQVTNL
jgi:hypothetical protein